LLDPAGSLVLGFAEPVILRGIPPLAAGGSIPDYASQVSPTIITLEYPGTLLGGEAYAIDDWAGTVRGLNGEVAGPLLGVIGSGAPGGLPDLVTIASITASGTDDLLVSLDGVFTLGTRLPQLLLAGDMPTAAQQITPDSFLLTYDVGGNTGNTWELTQWAAFSPADNRWIAPGTGVVP